MRGFLSAVAGLFVLAAIGCSSVPGKKISLQEYVSLEDDSYSWELLRSGRGDGYRIYFLKLVSQAWRTGNEVDRTLWTHSLSIIIPEAARQAAARSGSAGVLLIIDGGSNAEKPPVDAEDAAIDMALDSGKIVSRLGMVPNQPLGFAPDFRGRWEDDLIAHTWNLYMETGDQGWLARWPMVKSAARAMDAVEEFLASPPAAGFEDPLGVEGFIVTGASKRGWTTWLTGAADARVSAIVPVVIDVLNVIPSMDHHYAAYGFWAPAVRDYEEQGIMARKNEGIYRDLIRLVDPYYYRDQLKMPKYIVNSAGDQFFLPDSSQFYFDKLPGENYLRYVPNTDHSLSNSDARESIATYTSLVAAGVPRPKFSWSMEEDGSIRVLTADQPSEVRLWQAVNPDARDFRLATLGAAWSSRLLGSDGGGVYHGRVLLPEKGWIAFFVELTYTPAPGKKLKFTTAVRVLPNVLPYIEKLKVYRSRETP